MLTIKNSNLLKIISSFSENEKKRFAKFVESPFFNNQSTLVRLYKEIIKYYPDFNEKEISKAKIYQVVNPGKEFCDSVFRKQVSNLSKLAEEFLIHEDNSRHSDRRITSLLDQYQRRNIYSLYNKLSKEVNRNIENYIITNEAFYYGHFRKELDAFSDIRTNNLHEMNESLFNSHKLILLYLLQTSTVYSNMMFVNQKSFEDPLKGFSLNLFFKEFDILNYLESSYNLTNNEKLFVEICRCDLELLKDPFSRVWLDKMKNNIFKLSSYLSKNMQYTFFTHLNIFYLINIGEGKTEFNRKLFENYKFMIDKGLYISDEREYINFSEYRSILTIALKLKEFDWVEKYIAGHRNFHNPEERENIIKYSNAFLNFEKMNFDETLNLLSQIDNDNLIIKLDVHSMYLISYFEKGYIESALSLANSTAHTLKSNKILSKEAMSRELKFIKYYKLLVQNNTKGADLNKVEIIRDSVSKDGNFRRKKWILEKFDNLIGRLK
ncbi:MAG: hypothetical protein JSS91_06290 [Bacteroidetes bacterium]|nr:hypothetical protein [Bacteroidota bacterium]